MRTKLVHKFILLTIIWLALGAWTQAAFNFRANAGYVTDGTGQTYVLGDTYPTTRTLTGTADDVTFGWNAALVDGTRDRNNAIGPELAGINQVITPNSPRTFTVDLTAPGDYEICVANGDAVSNSSDELLEFYDDTVLLFSIASPGAGSIPGGEFKDATGVARTIANWAGDQVCVTETFTTTNFAMGCGAGGAGADNCHIAHISISAVTPPTPIAGVSNQFPMNGGMQ